MPELPEVEYTARQLRATTIGATIADVQVFWERTIGHPDLASFLTQIADRRIEAVRRRGKLLVLDLTAPGWTDAILTIHRRMTGNLLLLPPGWEIDSSLKKTDPLAWNTKGPTFKRADSEQISYCRVCFNFADGRRLLYIDPRKFGRMELWPKDSEQEAFMDLGLEPLSDEFTVERLMTALAGRKSAIKQVLLAQEVVAGLGNIYADESLFGAAIHPLRRANLLSAAEVRLLHKSIVSVLTLGIEHGGTTFSGYRDLSGNAGANYEHLQVYQQDGKPCVRCGTRIERIVIAQRSTHFCPHCQQLTVD